MNKFKSFLSKWVSEVIHSPVTIKAFHTFYQSFLAVWLLSGLKVDKITLIAAGAAGLSAVKTYLVTRVKG